MAKQRRRLGWTIILAALFGASAAARQPAPGCLDRFQFPLVTLSSKEAVRLLISQPKPAYPPAARVNYIRGKVRLVVTVGCKGKVTSVHVLEGHPFLAQAAIDAISHWVYRPYVVDSDPVPFQTKVNVNFDLRSTALRHFPPRPEVDLLRMVHPPRLISALSRSVTPDSPRLRMLVSNKGRVIDSTLLDGTAEEYQQASAEVTSWKFKPAKCDNLDVPWYVEMAVPVPSEAAPGGEERRLYPDWWPWNSAVRFNW
jgi:TonB family protein